MAKYQVLVKLVSISRIIILFAGSSTATIAQYCVATAICYGKIYENNRL
jgi:hypothetical protein